MDFLIASGVDMNPSLDTLFRIISFERVASSLFVGTFWMIVVLVLGLVLLSVVKSRFDP